MDIRSLADSRKVWFGVSTAIILAMIYFADLNKFISAIRTAQLKFLLPGFVLGSSIFLFWGFTWYRFFQRLDIDVPLLKSLRLFMAGQFMNSITPLGQFGGEPFLAYIIRKNTDASYEKALSAVISADIVNATPPFTFILGGSLYLLFLGSLNDIILETVYLALIAVVVGGGLVYLLWFKFEKIETALSKALKWFTEKIGAGQTIAEKIESRLQDLGRSFEMVGEEPVHLTKTAVVAHIGFSTQIFSLYLIMRSLGFVDPSFISIFFIIMLGMLASFSPTPGGSGTFEAAVAGLITFFFSTSFALALTVAIIFRIPTYWIGILIGYIAINTLENGK